MKNILVALTILLSTACGVEAPIVKPEPVRRVVEKRKANRSQAKAQPTPEPKPQPTPEPTHAPVRVEDGEAVATILKIFGLAGSSAVRVADCEAGDSDPKPPHRIDPAARNGNHAGAFQINVKIHAGRIHRLGFTPPQMFELEPNSKVAKDLFDEQGWGPWTCRWAA